MTPKTVTLDRDARQRRLSLIKNRHKSLTARNDVDMDVDIHDGLLDDEDEFEPTFD